VTFREALVTLRDTRLDLEAQKKETSLAPDRFTGLAQIVLRQSLQPKRIGQLQSGGFTPRPVECDGFACGLQGVDGPPIFPVHV